MGCLLGDAGGNRRGLSIPQRGCTWVALAGLLLVLVGSGVLAAPLPPFAPVDICGEIASHSWSDVVEIAGQPGLSGSLGHDRVFPARFGVELNRYTGISGETAALINRLLDFASPMGDRLFLLINSSDATLLDGAVTLCVTGFMVSGDEGGTWTHHKSLTVK